MRSIDCYDDALHFCQNTAPLRTDKTRIPIPWGGSGKRTRDKYMRLEPNGDIHCVLYGTSVVIWHPDDTVSVTGEWGSMTTSRFAWVVLPSGIRLDSSGYVSWHEDNSNKWYDWGDRASTRKIHAKVHICRPQRGYVRLKVAHDQIEMVSLDKAVPFEIVTIDRSKSLKAGKKYNIPAFRKWMEAVLALNYDEIANAHDREDVPTCLDALERGDYAIAARFLPELEHSNFQGYRPWNRQRSKELSVSCINKIRPEINIREGAITTTEKDVITLGEFNTWKANSRLYA